jgi:quercetin dioxygenase-like cupin family protein
MLGFLTEKPERFEDGVAAWKSSGEMRRSEVDLDIDVDTSTCFLYADRETRLVRGGEAEPAGQAVVLPEGAYACVPGDFRILDGSCLVIAVPDFTGLFSIGGPIEPTGRLRYIDGCTDTLLIAPPLYGEPCLNHLHLPPGTRQTMHTHPSVRIGIIARGRGVARTPGHDFPLQPGLCWRIPPDTEHCFYTDDEAMDVIAFHPDSDTGPRHDDHPMVNRTLVDGVSSVGMDAIRTK